MTPEQHVRKDGVHVLTKPRCTNDGCAQKRKLWITGHSEAQGATHYCYICNWGYWPWPVEPTLEELKAAQNINSKITKDMMTRTVLKPIPPSKYSTPSEGRMIDELGGSKRPSWLNERHKRYWRKQYCKKYPNSVIAKEVKALQDEEDDLIIY